MKKLGKILFSVAPVIGVSGFYPPFKNKCKADDKAGCATPCLSLDEEQEKKNGNGEQKKLSA